MTLPEGAHEPHPLWDPAELLEEGAEDGEAEDAEDDFWKNAAADGTAIAVLLLILLLLWVVELLLVEDGAAEGLDESHRPAGALPSANFN